MYTHKLPLYSECRRTHAKLEKLYTTSYSRESYYIVPRRVLSHAPRINNYLRPRERKHSRKQHNTVGGKKKSLSLFLKKQQKKKRSLSREAKHTTLHRNSSNHRLASRHIDSCPFAVNCKAVSKFLNSDVSKLRD